MRPPSMIDVRVHTNDGCGGGAANALAEFWLKCIFDVGSKFGAIEMMGEVIRA